MSELGIIRLKDGQRLFIEVEELQTEEQQRLKARTARGATGRPADLPPGAEPTGVAEDVVDALAQMRENIRVLATEVHQALMDHKPEQWAMEFSIGFKGKANPIPFVVQGEANAALIAEGFQRDQIVIALVGVSRTHQPGDPAVA